MITTPELVLFLFVAILGYSIAIFFLLKVFIVARSLQSGVPYVTSVPKYVDAALKILAPQSGEIVADLGSGSGSFIIEAAILNPSTKFVGIEINRGLVFWTRLVAWVRRVHNVKVVNGDLLDHDLSDYDKVYLYMTTDFLEKLMPLLEEQLPDGAIVVSICFRFGDEFEERHKVEVYDIEGEKNKIYVWRKDE